MTSWQLVTIGMLAGAFLVELLWLASRFVEWVALTIRARRYRRLARRRPSGPPQPLHPNCRCVVKRWEHEPDARARHDKSASAGIDTQRDTGR